MEVQDSPSNTSSGSGGVERIGRRNAASGDFLDLDVYKNSYNTMLTIFKKILPVLPNEEKYDLLDQLRRSCKAVPRLIAEGHSKRHQNKGFQKYIDDAHAESNETIVSLNQVKDLYASENIKALCAELIDAYDKISRQLHNLAASWNNYHRNQNNRFRKPPYDSPHSSA